MHLLRYVFKCTVTNSPFDIQASCSKCPPSAWIPFLTRVTRELLTLRSTAVQCFVRLEVLNHCELDPCVYDILDSESALELNPKVVTLTLGTPCIGHPLFLLYMPSWRGSANLLLTLATDTSRPFTLFQIRAHLIRDHALMSVRAVLTVAVETHRPWKRNSKTAGAWNWLLTSI